LNPAPLRLALIGDPVEHSASPVLHRAFMDRDGIAGSYDRIAVPPGEGKNAIVALRDQGFCGLNVTTPLKEEAYAACDRKAQIVLAVGAVNTIVFDVEHSEGPFGTNTDGAGAIAALRFATASEPGDAGKILVLGAGPTARASIYALVAAGGLVRVWNRTAERARDIAARFEARVWDGEDVDVVLSTLPPGAELEPRLRAAVVGAKVVIDANYGPRTTLAKQLGRDVYDGLAMLSGSARASFEVWASAHGTFHTRPTTL